MPHSAAFVMNVQRFDLDEILNVGNNPRPFILSHVHCFKSYSLTSVSQCPAAPLLSFV
jgi:hypothetical protein